MPNPYVSPLRVDVADGAQVLNTLTETIMFPDFSFAADDPRVYQGAAFRITAFGDISNVVTTPGTVRFRIRWGGVAGTRSAERSPRRLLHRLPRPLVNRYAPRSYNTSSSGDARFCMASEYGTVRDGGGYRDAMGVTYDIDGRDLGGRTKNIVPELKPSNEMDGRDPCDPYVGPTGRTIGGSAGYPAGSFER